MTAITLTYAGARHLERTLALDDGRTRTDALDVRFVAQDVERTIRQALETDEHDALEMSIAHYVRRLAAGHDDLVGIPVFPMRAARHRHVYVNARSGIERPEDLAGARVGVPDYAMTAAVWIRAFLQHDHGVAPEAIRWVCASPPAGDPRPPVDLEPVPAGTTLEELLESGAVDALIGPRAPASFTRGDAGIRRLFDDYADVEREYVRRVGFLPIMHLVVLRRRVYEQRPEVARALYDAFEASRSDGVKRLRHLDELALSDPWWEHRLEEMDALASHDLWAYGIDPNRGVLEALTSHLHEQGLSARMVPIEDLFAPELRGDAR